MDGEDLPNRRSIRLKAFDYAAPGAYFVTIVTHGRAPLFGAVKDGQVRLSRIGAVADRCWREIPNHFPHVELGSFVVMPNHVHILVLPRVPLATLTRRLKGYTARQANRILGRTGDAFWQTESYDHWVRSEQEWGRIVRYIESNPVGAGLVTRPEDHPWSSAAPAIALRRQDCHRGPQDCALHVDTDTQSKM